MLLWSLQTIRQLLIQSIQALFDIWVFFWPARPSNRRLRVVVLNSLLRLGRFTAVPPSNSFRHIPFPWLVKALLFCLPLLLIHLCSDLPLAFIKLLSRFQLLIQFVFEILLDSQLLPLPPVLNLSYPIEVISDALSLIFQQFVLESNLAKVSCTTIIWTTLDNLRVVKTSACYKSLMVELRAIRLNRIGIQQLHPFPNPQQVPKSSHLVMMLVQLGYILIRKTLLKKVDLARDQRLNIN